MPGDYPSLTAKHAEAAEEHCKAFSGALRPLRLKHTHHATCR